MIFPVIEIGPGLIRVKVPALRVEGSIALLKVALIAELGATALAPLAGLVKVTVGAVESGPEPAVKVQVNADAIGFSERSLAPVLIIAVYNTPAVNALLGVNVAAAPMAE